MPRSTRCTAHGWNQSPAARAIESGAANVESIIVAQPSAITAIASLVSKAPLGVLKDQLLVRSLDSYAPYLPSAFDKEQFSFYGTTLSGTPEQEARWKRAVNFTVGVLQDENSSRGVRQISLPVASS